MADSIQYIVACIINYLYRKVPKFSDAKSFAVKCNLPKILTKRPNLTVFCQNAGCPVHFGAKYIFLAQKYRYLMLKK